jgi:hypothetical protein
LCAVAPPPGVLSPVALDRITNHEAGRAADRSAAVGRPIRVGRATQPPTSLFWCLLSRGEDYAHQQPSLTAKKSRLLEIRAGAPTLKGTNTGLFATRQRMRQAERKLAERAEASYKRTVLDWQAAATKKAGASVTPGRA